MGILDIIRNRPKPFSETKGVSSIIVSSAKAWFIETRINNYKPTTIRLDIPIGCSYTGNAFIECAKRFVPDFQYGEKCVQRFIENEIKCVVVTFEDGTKEFRDLSFCDQDLPLNMNLEKELCVTSYMNEVLHGKIINYQNVKELHYKGLDFVPKWTPVNEQRLIDIFSEEQIRRIYTIPGEFGLDAVLELDNGVQRVFHIDNQSRAVSLDEELSAKDCYILTKRKYHTKLLKLVLVK